MAFEARSAEAGLWKKLVDAMKELVNETNIQCAPNGIAIQSMDAAHVALVSMSMRKDGFEMFHMERNTVLGMNMGNLAKILKTVDNGDSLTLRHDCEDNVLTLITDNKSGSRQCEYSLKLMEIDAEGMGIPDLDYKSSITMSSSEFAKICRDMNVFGDTITVQVNKEGVRFSADGDIGGAQISYKCPVTIGGRGEVKQEVHDTGVAEVKKEVKQEIKQEDEAELEFDEDKPMAGQLYNKGNEDAASKAAEMSAEMSEPVELSFALRYMTIFSKGSSLSDRVTIHLSTDQPCMVEYVIENVGYLRYFLAPKVEAQDQ